jgi:hypothetical protein
MMRVVGVLSLLVTAWLVVGCGGGGDEEPPDPGSFEDGLTAEEILERSGEATDGAELFRARVSETMEFLGSKSTKVTESAVAFDNVHSIRRDEDSRTEIVRLDGVGYLREAEDGAWEQIETDELAESFQGALDDALDLTATDDVVPVRLRDGEIDGRPMMRVRVSDATEVDLEESMRGLCDDLSELADNQVPSLPSALTPDEFESDLICWYGTDDFFLYRLESDVTGRKNGEDIMRLEQVIEVFDYGGRIVMPNPLAN